MLISTGQQVFGETEEDCAGRLRLSYGRARALGLSQVFGKTARGRPFKAYWRKVEQILGELVAPRESQAHLAKEDRLYYQRGGQRKRAFSLRYNTERN